MEPIVYRDFEIADASTLYALAEAIVASFDFGFDHAFGFYSKLKGNIYDSPVRYELFVDMGESDDGAQSVKRTRAADAFPSVGRKRFDPALQFDCQRSAIEVLINGAVASGDVDVIRRGAQKRRRPVRSGAKDGQRGGKPV